MLIDKPDKTEQEKGKTVLSGYEGIPHKLEARVLYRLGRGALRVSTIVKNTDFVRLTLFSP